MAKDQSRRVDHAAQLPKAQQWSKQDKQDLQDLFDSVKTGWPNIGHDEPGFLEHGVTDPQDPTLLATDERVHPLQIPVPQTGDKPVHPEVLGGDAPTRSGISKDEFVQIHKDRYGDKLETWLNNHALTGPRTGPLINTPLTPPRSGSLVNTPLPTSQGPLINMPLHGLPGGPMINLPLSTPGNGMLINQPAGKMSVADALKLRALSQLQAAGHHIAQQKVA